MTRETFGRHLRDLQNEMLVLGSMVQKAILRAVETLVSRDFEAAEQVIRDDVRINERRFQIEESCVTLIATQQPMAGDLRTILSALSIVTDLERMGDYASGIAEITLLLRNELPIEVPSEISRMADIGTEMLSQSLKAFADRDAEAARAVAERDDEIDALYHKLLQGCLASMSRDAKTAPIVTRLIWVGHNLERIGDRATNICERVIFAVTGRMVEINGP